MIDHFEIKVKRFEECMEFYSKVLSSKKTIERKPESGSVVDLALIRKMDKACFIHDS